MQSIRTHLLISLLITGLFPLAIIYFVTGNWTASALTKAEFAKIKEMSVQVAGQLESVMNRAADDLKSLSTNPVISNPFESNQERYKEIKRLVGVYNLFSDITIYDPDGFILVSTAETEPENKDMTSWFQKAVRCQPGERVVSEPHKLLYDPTGRLYMSVYVPVFSEGRKLANILKARISFDSVWELFDRVELGENGFMTLVDARGNYLTHPKKSKVFSKYSEGFDIESFKSTPEGFTDEKSEHGESLFVANIIPSSVTRSRDEWVLIAFEPKSEVESLVVEQRSYQLGVGIVTLLFVVVLGFVLGSVYSRPLIYASAVASAVSRGVTAAKIADDGPREMRALASSFNKMVDELRHHRNHLQSLVLSRTKRLEESQVHLENVSAQLRASYEAAAEAICVIGLDGKVIAANQKVAKFFGVDRESVEGMEAKELVRVISANCEASEVQQKLMDRLAPEGAAELELSIARPHSLILSMYSAPVKGQEGSVLAQLWMFRDLTEQRLLQANLEQSQKMDAIGRLAGGVAHDFNNLLTGIMGNLSLIELDIAESNVGDVTDGYITSAKKASQRAADLVRQLLGFSRQTTLRMRKCEVGEIVTEVKELLHAFISPDIDIVTDVSKKLWTIEADSTQIQQVLMNMCVNAKDALPEGGGTITVSAKNSKVSRKTAALNGVHGTEFINLTIQDNGTGIPPEVLEKIWEPFFTTKEQGKGTGLGLATSYGIVQQHGGWIDCESVVGKGTAFHVYVPRHIYSEEETTENVEDPIERGTETILLVDDEVMVRTVAQGFLKRQGYKTQIASDGLEAVEIVSERGKEIDLILLDLTMPRLSGKDTFRKIREMYGDMPVVICSGYLLDIGEFQDETGFRPSGMVQKPYRTEDLLSSVRKAIDARPVEDTATNPAVA